ncbi:MAG: ribbon-helix-helix domain-containing protein [Xanthobacteraceae bacterium]|nr:ribbon-helix-helix domain-containing protein [Xanthobacteraceae bacterium]
MEIPDIDTHALPLSSEPRGFAVVKRSVMVGGHKTSVSLEDAFWTSLKEIAVRNNMSLSGLLITIDRHRKTSNLSSAIRLFVLDYFRTRATSLMFIGERQMASPGERTEIGAPS